MFTLLCEFFIKRFLHKKSDFSKRTNNKNDLTLGFSEVLHRNNYIYIDTIQRLFI